MRRFSKQRDEVLRSTAARCLDLSSRLAALPFRGVAPRATWPGNALPHLPACRGATDRRSIGSAAAISYLPKIAQRLAWARRLRRTKLERRNQLGVHVCDRLAMGWSPEQIAGRLDLPRRPLPVGARSWTWCSSHQATNNQIGPWNDSPSGRTLRAVVWSFASQ